MTEPHPTSDAQSSVHDADQGTLLKYTLICYFLALKPLRAAARTRARRHMPGALCPCGLRRYNCRTHNGGSFCECRVRKQTCRVHGRGSMCAHARCKRLCKDCLGSAICEHQSRRSECWACAPSGYLWKKVCSATTRAFQMKGMPKSQVFFRNLIINQ